MENEYIVAPAIRKDNEIRISRFCHAEMISCDFFFEGAEQGFITNYDRFVDRKEALKIAKRNNNNLHKVCESDELYSEDLFMTEFELVKENEELKKQIPSLKNGTYFGEGSELFRLQNELNKILEANGLSESEEK